MNILVTGSSGLVGSALIPFLAGQGHHVKRFIRTGSSQSPDTASLERMDAVVHLAGESLASRWTEKKKLAIRNSRVNGTRSLVESLTRTKNPPKLLISASAIGYYGNHDAQVISDGGAPGHDFLADVCRDWEEATTPASQNGIRTVNLRFGVILSERGGALSKMLLPFKMGVGGKIASGQQYMSWIALDDILGVIQWALTHDSLRGPVNTVAPKPVTNEEFTKTLGRVLKRPTLFPMPALAARMVFGEMADALLIGGARIEPTKLIQSGYAFQYPDLESALRHLLIGKHRIMSTSNGKRSPDHI